MAKTNVTTWFITGTILLVLTLIGIYLYNAFAGNTALSGSPILFFVIIGFIMVSIIFILKQTGQSALDLDNLVIPVAVAGVLIYLIIKYPQLVPASFSIAAQRSVGMLPGLLVINLPWLNKKSLVKVLGRLEHEKW